MKRVLSWMLMLALVIGCFQLPTAKASSVMDDGTKSVDIVIVLDQSNSMTAYDTNDPKGYRLDAAQMLIAMCDMNGSRVAVIPFNKTVEDYAHERFQNIDTQPSRASVMSTIGNWPNTSNGTDYGEALAVAYNLLANRSNTENAPVIILLTDGQNSLDQGYKKPLYAWDAATGRFVRGNSPVTMTAQKADDLADAVVAQCALDGIPVYTVALYHQGDRFDPKTVAFVDKLERFAVSTGAQTKDIPSNNASSLPEFFADVFAREIGSSEPEVLSAIPVAGEEGWYEVKVPILNASVMEANLLVAMESVVKGSVTLHKPAANGTLGQVVNNDNPQVMMLESEHFMMYKITNGDTGEWTLRFRLAPNKTLDDLSFNLLYNYNLTIKPRASVRPGQLSEGGVSSAAKTDTLYLEAYFENNATRTRSSDSALYTAAPANTPHSAAWKYITATWELLNANGNPVGDGTILPNGSQRPVGGEIPSDLPNQSRFYTEIDLRNLVNGADGVNELKAGTYQIRVTVKGAGLEQTATLPITIVNAEPAVVGGSTITIGHTVEDEAIPGSFDVHTFTYDFGALVQDADGEKVTFDGLSNDAGDPAVLTWQGVDRNTGMVTFTTNTYVNDQGETRLMHGRMNLTLYVSDSDNASVAIPVVIDVESVKASAENGSFTLTPAEVTLGKNESVTVTAKAEPAAMHDGMVIEPRLESVSQNGAGIYTPEEMAAFEVITVDETTGKITIPTGNTAADWTVKVGFYLSGSRIGTAEMNIKVNNSAPTVNAAEADKIPEEIKFDGRFWSMLEPDTPEEERTVDFTRLFSDADNEAGLVYEVIVSGVPEEAPVKLADPAQNPVVVIEPLQAGEATVTLRATDGDGEIAEVVVTIKVINMWQKWAFYWAVALAALIVLILLLRAVYWAGKPRFPRNTQLVISEGQSLAPTSVCDVQPGKKPERIINFVGGLAETYQLQGLDQVCIEPLRGRRDGSIRLYMNKKVDALSAMLESDELKPGKKNGMVWAVNQKLYLQPAGGGESINVMLRNLTDAVLDDPNGGGWNDGVTNDNMGFGDTTYGADYSSGFESSSTDSAPSDDGGFDFGSDDGSGF